MRLNCAYLGLPPSKIAISQKYDDRKLYGKYSGNSYDIFYPWIRMEEYSSKIRKWQNNVKRALQGRHRARTCVTFLPLKNTNAFGTPHIAVAKCENRSKLDSGRLNYNRDRQ